jgi:hypothetical protein
MFIGIAIAVTCRLRHGVGINNPIPSGSAGQPIGLLLLLTKAS